MHKVFIAKNKVRMHDTDMAGLLYFPRQFRFSTDALEDFIESQGLGFEQMFKKEKFVFVIVHAEADYYKALKVGDSLNIHLSIAKLGKSSFNVEYQIHRMPEDEIVGRVQTVHVCLDSQTREKISIPPDFKKSLEPFLLPR